MRKKASKLSVDKLKYAKAADSFADLLQNEQGRTILHGLDLKPGRIVSKNDNGTFNIAIEPDDDHVVTMIPNPTVFDFKEGDPVQIMVKDQKYTQAAIFSGGAARTSIRSDIKPQIGANGNWWFGGEDTGVTAVAKDGDTYVPVWNGTRLHFVKNAISPTEAVDLKGDKGSLDNVNTGAFNPTSDDPASQKSIMDAIIEADLNARVSRVSSGNLAGAFANLPSYYSGKFYLLRGTAFPWGNDIDLSYLFTYSGFTEVDYSPYLNSVFEHASSINMKQCFLSSAVRIINAAYSLKNVTNMENTFAYCSNLKTIKLRDYPVSFDISFSTKFEEADLVEILNNLMDLTGKTPQTLTMGATNLAKLTNAEKVIALLKNWVLA